MNIQNTTFNKPQDPATTTALPAPTATGFSLGNVGVGDTGKTMPTLTGMQNAAKPMFNFGIASTTSNLTFPSGQNLSMNLNQTTSAPSNTSFATPTAFGTNPLAGTGFGASSAAPGSATSAAPTNLTFGGAALSTPASGGFTLGSAPAPATPAAPTSASSLTAGLLASSTPATTATLASLTAGAPASSAPTGFSLGTATSTAPASTATGFSLGSAANQAATTTMLGAFSLSGATPAGTTQSTGFNLGSTSTATGFSLGKSTAATTTSTTTPQTTNTAQTTLGTATTVSASSSSGQTGAMNFCQLEEAINKWTLELEEQEKVFMNQAAQINTWDKLLIANGEKIVTLNQQVERVKLEQQQLEHELDYVVGQQKELQDCLVPLEKELASVSVSDPEREYTYRLAEKLDTQLKQMSEDLKEIIEHLNEANRAQDSSDPIVQIGKILNAHMNSLSWIDQRTTILTQKIQQIDQMHQNFRQENERNFSLAYN